MTERLAAQDDTALTAGAWLRLARQQAGQSIDAVAATLKIPVRTLAALEADDHAGLRDAVFIRALAQSVCRVLHRDPAPVLALLPLPAALGPRPLSTQDEIRSTDMRFKRRAQWPAFLFGRLTLVLMLIVLVALAVAFVPDAWLALPSGAASGTPAAAVTPVVVEPPSQPETRELPAGAVSSAPVEAAVPPVAPAAHPTTVRP